MISLLVWLIFSTPVLPVYYRSLAIPQKLCSWLRGSPLVQRAVVSGNRIRCSRHHTTQTAEPPGAPFPSRSYIYGQFLPEVGSGHGHREGPFSRAGNNGLFFPRRAASDPPDTLSQATIQRPRAHPSRGILNEQL